MYEVTRIMSHWKNRDRILGMYFEEYVDVA